MARWLSLAATAVAVARVAAGFTAAVVQHEVATGADPVATVAANLERYAVAAANASAQGAQLVVFPEFGLGIDTSACTTPQTPNPYCEPINYTNGTVVCGSAAGGSAAIAAAASCMARNHSVWVSINSCEAAADGNYNTQLIFDADGAFVTSYRKSHPWYTSCFVTPATPDLVTFSVPFLDAPIGVFTCFDILFPSPGPALAKAGVRHFVYSSAIPLVAAGAEELWSATYHATLIGSNLQDGMTGVYANGTRLTPTPPSGVPTVLLAEIF